MNALKKASRQLICGLRTGADRYLRDAAGAEGTAQPKRGSDYVWGALLLTIAAMTLFSVVRAHSGLSLSLGLLGLLIFFFSAWHLARGVWSHSAWLRMAASAFLFLSLLVELLTTARITLGLTFVVLFVGLGFLLELYGVLRRHP
jgi:hypothetical protein